jgi:site-specific DNA-methyltransferase (adenine-specific)
MSKVSIRGEELISWAKSYTGPKFHAVLSDPPYGLHFMNAKWDEPKQPTKGQVVSYMPAGQRMTTTSENIGFQNSVKQWGEAILPHLFPGALVMMFGGTRMFEWLSTGMQMAGFEHWDTMMWLHGEGFPKGGDISKLIDRKSGKASGGKQIFGRPKRHSAISSEPLSPEAAAWIGYKTPQLKPSWEPILCFRAPRGKLIYAELALQFATGALNIDGCRIGDEELCGRHPANLILECICEHTELVPDKFGGGAMMSRGGHGLTTGTLNQTYDGQSTITVGQAIKHTNPLCPAYQLDEQSKVGASRYFYCAKASKKERNAGLADVELQTTSDGRNIPIDNPFQRGKKLRHNGHPCVKPLALTRYVATLLLPPASVAPRRLLVPFAGSGSEMIGALQAGWDQVVGIEQDAHYCEIAEKRIALQQRGSTTKPLANRLEVVSTFLYSGRKQWFVKHAAKYFRAHPCQRLIEPFSGSGVVGLSLLHAGIIDRLVLVEKDERIVCLLRGLLNDPGLADRYAAFKCIRANVERLLRDEKSAFRYLVESRCRNRGKFDGGLRTVVDARWCADLVVENIRRVYAMRDRIKVIKGDGLEVIGQYVHDPNVGCFADPTYTADVKSKGHTLYRYHKLNHQKLFSILASWHGPWLLTEDNTRMVRNLASSYRFSSKRIRMVTGENKKKNELVLWRKRRLLLLPPPSSVVGIRNKGEAR